MRFLSIGLLIVALLAPSAPAETIVPEVVSSFATPGGAILAMTWGDGNLWLADENRIIYRMSTTGQVLGYVNHNIAELTDLAWFENTIWVHDGTKTYKLSMNLADHSSQITETLNVGLWWNSGMEWAEGYLYVGDYNSSDIHKYDRSGNHIYSWPTDAIFGHPEDMIYDWASLWITDSCEGFDRGIYEYSLSGQPGRVIDVSGVETCTWPPDRALAWDGRYFWYGGRLTVYQLNIGGDDVPPVATVVSPGGGEYWLLSDVGSPANTEVITWSMSDNVRLCQARVSLWYSNNGGTSYQESSAGGGLPATFGPGGSCTGAGERTTSLTYSIPTTPPSGTSGSLYKIQVEVTDAAGNTLVLDPPSGLHAVRSTNPFYIVRPNPDSVRTIILKNTARMQSVAGVNAADAAALDLKLQELADHPRVQGLVVDLSTVTDISQLYAAWDADPGDPNKANAVLFGCHSPYPTGCPTDRERIGIHEHLRSLLVSSSSATIGSGQQAEKAEPVRRLTQEANRLEIAPLSTYSGVKYLVLVGDDRIIPMARIQDRTILLSETNYPAGGDIRPVGTPVGEALAAGKYLTDDPVAVLDAISSSDLSGNLYLPDLAPGRLVETPQEIITTIATYIGQDGILDISLLDANSGHKVLVTGYDFLTNVATHMRSRWKSALGVSTPTNSTAPVDGTLIGGLWGLGSVSARATALRTSLSGYGGPRYGIMAIAGHATHYEEGVPGTDGYDIQGLSTADIYGPTTCSPSAPAGLDLAGGVIYAVGCHGGLNVPGSCSTDADHSLDLPQTMLRRGAVAYIANSGYGWGLKHGIGYGARLSQIFTEQVATGGTVAVGDVVRQSKQRYYLETPRYDAYDEKSVMQWTLYGLPMYAVKSGIVAGSSLIAQLAGPPRHSAVESSQPAQEWVGGVKVTRRLTSSIVAAPVTELMAVAGIGTNALPAYVTQLNLSFDFTAAGVYDKHDSTGAVLPTGPGCPDTNGCYYTLNGLVDRGTGSGDIPIQPYLVFDSRLSGTSQHGVLWKGGTYDEESGWKPIIAELVSNGGNGSNHGAAPRIMKLKPTAPRVVPGVDSPTCRPSDIEINSLTLTAGEAVKPQQGDLEYSIARRYRTMDLEVLYFNNRATPAENCDRGGPELGAGPYGGNYHQVNGTTVQWSVPATDTAGAWRVLVVYTTNTLNAQGRGTWTPVELTNNGSGTFVGSAAAPPGSRVTYVIQAVDGRGNVTWLDWVSTDLPASGVPLGVAKPMDLLISGTPIAPPATVTASAQSATSVEVSWTAVTGAARYDVYRRSAGSGFTFVGSSPSSGFTDNTAAAAAAYLYAIRTVDSWDNASAQSAADLATTVIFTDPVLTPGVTAVKAAHFTELRTAVTAVAALAATGTPSYTGTLTPATTIVQALHLTELRAALTAARAALPITAATFAESIGAGATAIKASHITELRNGVQ